MVATGKWYLRSDAANALGVDEKTFNKRVKLGNTQIFREAEFNRGGRVYESHT